MSDIAIKFNNISKRYEKGPSTIRESITKLFRRFTFSSLNESHASLPNTFWALKNVSFEVKKGNSLGIIGPNGAGKSTILKLIAGITEPTSGKITINGKIGVLIELGAGFHPDFTGRENIYLNGAIMGMSKKQIDEKLDAIVDFADIRDFIDTPVKHFSSGMYMRLGFSIATHSDPDILLVDEVLAVGDTKFQAKCFRKFEEFQDKKKTILFVSHSIEQINRYCNKAMLINNGMKLSEGEPRSITNQYMDLLFGKSSPRVFLNEEGKEYENFDSVNFGQSDNREVAKFINEKFTEDRFATRKSYNKYEYRWGDNSAEIIDYLIVSGKEVDPVQCNSFDELNLYLKIKFHKAVERPIYGLTIKTVDGITLYSNNSRDWNGLSNFIAQKAGDIKIILFSFKPRLVTGEYLLSVGLAEEVAGEVIPLDRRYDSIHLSLVNPKLSSGLVDLEFEFKNLI